jgi:hypothetical protein
MFLEGMRRGRECMYVRVLFSEPAVKWAVKRKAVAGADRLTSVSGVVASNASCLAALALRRKYGKI